MFNELKARFICRIPPREYLTACLELLRRLSDIALRAAATDEFIDLHLAARAEDAKFFADRETQIFVVTAQALNAYDIEIGSGRIQVLTYPKLP